VYRHLISLIQIGQCFLVEKFYFLINSISDCCAYVRMLCTVFPFNLMWIYLGVKWLNLHILLNDIAALVLNNFSLVIL
jgi:hypothetical protein